uniref:Thioredoxin 2 n=1 Tax=Latimeria chalumnae TaxID=7897 RepID=H3A1K5_LATCH
MAQQMFLRRLASLRPCHLAALPRLPMPHRQSSATPLLPNAVANTRFFMTSPAFRFSFTVQDGQDFDEKVLKNEKPVIVDFHAQWCGPCKILGPRLEKMVAKQKGKVVMAKVDIDDHTDLAIDFEVSFNLLPKQIVHASQGVKPRGASFKNQETGCSCCPILV